MRILAAVLVLSGASSAFAQKTRFKLLPDKYFSELPEEFQVRRRWDEPRNVYWPTLASFVLPGLDQWWEGQHPYGAGYSATATGGFLYAQHHARELFARGVVKSENDEAKDGFSQPGERERRILWGLQLYQLSGSLSSYHAYRSALWTHKSRGQYSFIGRQESMSEILMAPLRFSFLKRSTTLWPLGIGLGLHVLAKYYIKEDPNIVTDAFTTSDAFFTGAISYGAGVGEEALFRGFILPETREITGSDFWSNAFTSVLFAAAHLQSVERPIAQLALGYYWGHLTIRNRWEIAESIFIHTWWDVIAFLTVFQIVDKEQPASSHLRPSLRLPPLELRF